MKNPAKRSTVMIVDDTPANLKLLQNFFQEDKYRILAFPRGKMAIKAASDNPPDIILLDIKMPEIDGFEVCRLLKSDTSLKDIPVLFISSLDDTMDKVTAFTVGGLDYITKPFQKEEVQARVRTHLHLRKLQKEMELYNDHLRLLVHEQVQQISDSQLSIIHALSELVEARDGGTGGHITRTKYFCRIIAESCSKNIYYKESVNSAFIENIFHSAPLHDIGKFSISDDILLKPDKLTSDEFEVMKTHVMTGVNVLKQAQKNNLNNNLLNMGIDITRTHHERYDGTGYPVGLKGDEIPICGRIMALADVYDALRSPRPYKPGFSHRESVDIILNGSGIQFDPGLIEIFLKVENSFNRFYELYK